MKKVLVILLACMMIFALAACSAPAAPAAASAANAAESTAPAADGAAAPAANANAPKAEYNFIVIPKVVHEWFDAVNAGAQVQAQAMEEALGIKVNVDFRAPTAGEITEQNTILEQAAATNPDGIAIDPLDFEGSRQIVEEIQAKGIPVVIFDAVVPGYTSIGNDFTEQAELEARKLAELLNGKGKVAIMHGVPTAANHAERYDAMHRVFAEEFPGIEVIDGGASQDTIETAQQQAAAVLAANPDLNGYLCVDAAAPIGISAALEEAGKQDDVIFVGAENLLQILQYIKSGTIECSYSTKPQMMGAMTVMMMLQGSMGMDMPKFVDTGILYIDSNNVDEWIEIVSSGARETTVSKDSDAN